MRTALPNLNMKHYELVKILSNFQNVKFHCANLNPLFKTFWRRFWFQNHIFSRDSSVAFDSYQCKGFMVSIETKRTPFRYNRKITAWVPFMDVPRTIFTSQSSLDLPKASGWLANSVRGCRLKIGSYVIFIS